MKVSRAGLLIAALVAGAVIGACGDDGSPSPLAPTPTATASRTTATSAAVSPSPAATTSPTVGGVPRCTNDDLDFEVLQAGAAAGTHFISIAVTNRASRACTVQGYPGVSLVDAAGLQLGAAADRNPAVGSALLTLAPGSAAHALAGFPAYQNFPAGRCTGPSKDLKVYAPEETRAVLLPLSDYACPGFSVRAFEPGKNEAGR